MSRLTARRADHGSALQLYVRQIDATPLLSAEQERELAEQIALGDPEARDRMARANLRLVVNLARGYQGRGVALEDLIAEGNLGLMRAVEGFDPAAGVRFSTYAAYWIKQAMRTAVMRQGRLVRLPAYTHTLLAKWRRAAAALNERLGRAPTDDEIGKALGLSERKFRVALEALRAAELARHEDDAEDGGGASVLAGLVGAGRGPDERAGEAEELGRVLGRLDDLEPRQAAVVKLRFGLGDEPPLTLREVGERLGLTRERVRQLEKLALAELTAAARPQFAGA